MLKIALHFICKNEAHIIERMLHSVRPIVDLIVAVDTGSTDKTIEKIKDFGHSTGIPTRVLERPFDNFCNSRNHALNELYNAVDQLGWTKDKCWAFSIDCDETLNLLPAFDKEDLGSDGIDIYIATVRGSGGSFNRQLFFNLAKKFSWQGPIHEIITWNDPSIKEGHVNNLYVQYESVGASWKGNLEQKFLNYASLLTKYINEGHEEFRWYRYTADSYTAAANNCRSNERKNIYLVKAKEMLEKSFAIGPPTLDEAIVIYRALAENQLAQNIPWIEVAPLYYKVFTMDPRRAESISRILLHYMKAGRWQVANIFSSFSVKLYHNSNPYGQGVAETDDKLYQWQLLLYYYICCYHIGKKEAAKLIFNDLKTFSKENQQFLESDDIMQIRANAPIFLKIRKLNPLAKQTFYAVN